MQITISAVGTKPLLLHNVDLANPLNPWARKMTELRRTRSNQRTEKWYEEMAEAGFMGAFYNIPDVKFPAIPSENLRRSIVDAAKASRRGTQALRALLVTFPAVPILVGVPDGERVPETAKAMWDEQKWHLTRMIRGTGGASPTTYPIFRDWAVKVPFELDEDTLSLRDLTEIAERAGRIEGLGASRKQAYGRYTALVKTS